MPKKPALIFIIQATQRSDEHGKLAAHSLQLAVQESATNLVTVLFLAQSEPSTYHHDHQGWMVSGQETIFC